MGEIEVPTEHLHEHMEHEAHHGKEGWLSYVALSSAILAVLAAISALLAGHHVDEAMLLRMEASDQWSYYQAKSVKRHLVDSQHELLVALGRKPSAEDKALAERYDKEKEEIKEKAEKLEEGSHKSMQHHSRLARAVTLFQIAIALGAISALSKTRPFFLVSLVFGAVGAFFLSQSLLLK